MGPGQSPGAPGARDSVIKLGQQVGPLSVGHERQTELSGSWVLMSPTCQGYEGWDC